MNKNCLQIRTIKGIGGWLLLLILFLGLYIPVTGAWSLYKEFILVPLKMPILEANPLWVQYRLMVWIVFGILCALCFAAGYAIVANQKTDDGSAGYRRALAGGTVRSGHLCRHRFGYFQYGLFTGSQTVFDRYFFDICPERDLDRVSPEISQGQKYLLFLKTGFK